jgi:hypothetical protein
MLVQSIVDRVVGITNDPLFKRASLADVLRWANEGAELVAMSSPVASAKYVILTLVAGAMQDMRVLDPTVKWIKLRKLVCNCNGASPTGARIREVSLNGIEAIEPNWRARTPSTIVYEYIPSADDPLMFETYPPAAAGVKVYAETLVLPPTFGALDGGGTALADPAEVFPLPAGFDIPVVDYTVFRIFLKDAGDPGYATRANTHLTAFNAATGLAIKGDTPEQGNQAAA